jgi:hypothetical protein
VSVLIPVIQSDSVAIYTIYSEHKSIANLPL